MNILHFATVKDAPELETFDDALALVTALANPTATAAALQKLRNAVAEAHEATAQADARIVEADRRASAVQQRHDALDADLALKQAESDRRLENERRAFEESTRDRLRALKERERAAAAAYDRNVELHADLERRLAAIRAAAS
jgi:hypothetical protein